MDNDLARLKALALAATMGPWECREDGNGGAAIAHLHGWLLELESENENQDILDSRYIAAANPSVVLDLIARIERLTAVNAAYVEEIETDEYSMTQLLAKIVVAIKGPEPARKRWSYHDLPEIAEKMKIELEVCKLRLVQGVPPGWKLMPHEATDAIAHMAAENENVVCTCYQCMKKAYRDMFAAAPAPPGDAP